MARPMPWLRTSARSWNRGLWKQGDGRTIDGIGPDGIAARTIDLSVRASRLQTGYLYHYAFAMMIGVAGLITWFMFAGAH